MTLIMILIKVKWKFSTKKVQKDRSHHQAWAEKFSLASTWKIAVPSSSSSSSSSLPPPSPNPPPLLQFQNILLLSLNKEYSYISESWQYPEKFCCEKIFFLWRIVKKKKVNYASRLLTICEIHFHTTTVKSFDYV